ncbi:ADL209Cp [Eremothecium gossypii ATCC 10895]|uniref:U3 small nucleolar RNA-associated protein 25 n=1 Tax=Eremothecium gossypii (strain ATCC 10895 / CBS 109.51 / FGSC 9923 / NRRL Y-1056) TaxID=284811 RepID=UTP25_EREGS|nr:ADL209Cp [Eremothecium gossypii ATCC 10895]Q75AX9.1 RecName: Full=U3 small nucleolar RNA-associated protein 25; Short=U3 snoRNA-associated protein 25; AltName: Full=U three protein 25 [Eremothecium gossypii ATCC 10895]AAS51711.1 ADL209Cp [Eremothecium gossypii ATCC 10895]
MGITDSHGIMDGKRGRKQLRNITRIGRAIHVQEDEAKSREEHTVEEAQAGEQTSNRKRGNHPAEDDGGARESQSYGALLTLLSAEHGKQRKKRLRKAEAEAAEAAEAGEDPEEAITAALENSAQDAEDAEDAFDDSGESDEEQDHFDVHFNRVSAADVAQLDAAFKNGRAQYRVQKEARGEEEILYSKPVASSEGTEGPVRVPARSLRGYAIKQRLRMHNGLTADDPEKPLTPQQKVLLDPMFQYQDILYEYEGYDREREYRELYTLHILNHVYKTRDRILKNNQKLQDNPDQELLDQGFTRPKALVVVPTRATAYDVVDLLLQQSGIEQVDKKSKFKDQFYDPSLPPASKPKSFQHVFKGNTNDFFVLGMKFTRKAIRLYSNFYQSDVIVCSPLGLQLIIENTDKKKRQDDFLSSIEVMVLDQLHSIEFQNIAHVSNIFAHINKIPQQQRDADFSRIRMWYIEDQAKLFRQTMVFTRYISPFANALLNRKCANWAGRVKSHRVVSAEKSVIGQLGLKLRQIFQRFEVLGGSTVDEPDFRFKFFTSVVVPGIEKTTGYDSGILLYIPEYTDFIRVRNYLKDKTRILFGDINEYSDQRQLTSNRALFQLGRIKVLLYTERLHHFRRFELKGVKSVILYKPPSNPEFYQELLRYIGKSAFLGVADLNIATVRCLYSKMDSLALERIVGTKRAAVLTHGQNEVYEFK